MFGSEQASLRVICGVDMNTVRRPSDRYVNWMPSAGTLTPFAG